MEAGLSVRFVVSLLMVVRICSMRLDEKELKESLLPNVNHSFPVDIGAVNHIVQGRISFEAYPGTLVPSNVVLEGDVETDFQVHLRVEVRDSIYTRPHVYDPRIKVNTSDPSNPQFKHPVIHFTDGPLPYGMELVVLHTDAFTVDKDRFIVVNNFAHLDGETRVHFHVILKDKLAETHYVSNHLPFVVEIEYPKSKPNPNAALFAGVLILTIMAISLIIPFVVRAKRRAKAGKPVCGCGSADDTSDSGSTAPMKEVTAKTTTTSPIVNRPVLKPACSCGMCIYKFRQQPIKQDSIQQQQCSTPELMKQRAMSIGGMDNLAMILDNGRLMHHRPSIDQHTTIQNHMLRSTSNMNFQPHYLDPHYQDIYDRPDFTNLPTSQYGQGPYNHGHTGNMSGFARGYGQFSNRSSANSIYNYPANFNPTNIMNNMNKRKYVKHSNGRKDTVNGDVTTTSSYFGGNHDEEKVNGTASKAEAAAAEPSRMTVNGGVLVAASPDEIEAVTDSASGKVVTDGIDSSIKADAKL